MKYHFRIHDDQDGPWAECLELPGCVTQADSPEGLPASAAEALDLYLTEPLDSGTTDPLPDESLAGPDIIAIPVQPAVALSVLIRHYRKTKQLSQTAMMEILQMKSVYSYQRLERKTDPKLSTLARLKKIIPELSIDYILNV